MGGLSSFATAMGGLSSFATAMGGLSSFVTPMGGLLYFAMAMGGLLVVHPTWLHAGGVGCLAGCLFSLLRRRILLRK